MCAPLRPEQGIFRTLRFAVALATVLMWPGKAPARDAEPEFVIEIRAHRFVPAEVHVPAATKVRIVLVNSDSTAEEFDSHSLNREKHVPPNSRITLFIGPLDPGRYVFESESDGSPGGPALGVVVVQ